MSDKCLDDELYDIYIEDGKQIIESLREIYEKGRADVIKEVKELAKHYLIDAMNLESATKYGNKNENQICISYGTLMRYEIADYVDDFMDLLEQLGDK